MAGPAPSVDAKAAQILRQLELDVNRRLDGLLQGDYRGLVPGHGSEAGETRPYTFGDDVRRIDWNVSARTIDTQVRETIADRELETWVLLDRSASLDFGTARMTKQDLAIQALGAIGLLTARTGNRLGALVVGPEGTSVVPARPGRPHLFGLLDSLITGRRLTPIARDHGAGDEGPRRAGAAATTDLGRALAQLVVPPRRRGLVVVISDFLAAEGWERHLRALAGRHDVLAIEIVDPRELELPPVGLLQMVDTETGKTREVPTNRKTRARYAAAASAQRADIAQELRMAGASHLRLQTDRDWVVDLAAFVRLRRTLAGARR